MSVVRIGLERATLGFLCSRAFEGPISGGWVPRIVMVKRNEIAVWVMRVCFRCFVVCGVCDGWKLVQLSCVVSLVGRAVTN